MPLHTAMPIDLRAFAPAMKDHCWSIEVLRVVNSLAASNALKKN
jgi:hypothetical protein